MSDIKLYADLYDNALTEKEGDCTARPRSNGTVYNKDIAQRIVDKRTEYRYETIVNILGMADDEKSLAIAQGQVVVDGVGQYVAQIKGSFANSTESFDPKKHSLVVAYTSGKTLRKRLLQTEVVTSGAAIVGPVIGGIVDSSTGKDDGTFTPGMPIVVSGSNIKIAGTSDKIGFFFASTKADASPVKASVLVFNNPPQLTVMVPADLPVGDYHISVCTQYGRSTLVKEPRTYEYPIVLTCGKEDDDHPVID